MALELSVPALLGLLREGRARAPASWGLRGAEAAGLIWRVGESAEIVATPALIRLALTLSTEGEALGALLATEPELRERWLGLEAARLRELGRREAPDALCAAVEAAGPAARALRVKLADARLAPTGLGALELAVFGGPADQPVASLPLRRALSATAPLIEGGMGTPSGPLPTVQPDDPSVSWRAGRLLQAPGAPPRSAGTTVLSGTVEPPGEDRLAWVLETPWATLLGVLAFTAEAWAAERRGGVQLELPMAAISAYGAPPRVDVVVTLPDGREVLCGSLGELCVRTLDALGMALVPWMAPAELDAALAPIIAALLRAEVWVWQAHARPRYQISDGFSRQCYGRAGHQAIYLNGEGLSQTLRSVCLAWARARVGQAP